MSIETGHPSSLLRIEQMRSIWEQGGRGIYKHPVLRHGASRQAQKADMTLKAKPGQLVPHLFFAGKLLRNT